MRAAVVRAVLGGLLVLGTALLPAAPAPATTGDVEATYSVGHGNHVYAAYRRGAHDLPWVVAVHAGYWSGGSGRAPDLVAFLRRERARGFAAFSVDYRLVPAVHWPTPQRDVRAALVWIRAHAAAFGLDPRRGFVVGWSAGGLLAASAALDLGGFAGVVSMAGVLDPYDTYRHDPDRRLRAATLALLGGLSPTRSPRAWQTARAATHLGAHRMPFLLVQSRGDRVLRARTAVDFGRRLAAAGYPVQVTLLPGTSHTLRTVAARSVVDRWLAAVLAVPTR